MRVSPALTKAAPTPARPSGAAELSDAFGGLIDLVIVFGEAGGGDVLPPVKADVPLDLIGDDEDIPLLGHLAQHL